MSTKEFINNIHHKNGNDGFLTVAVGNNIYQGATIDTKGFIATNFIFQTSFTDGDFAISYQDSEDGLAFSAFPIDERRVIFKEKNPSPVTFSGDGTFKIYSYGLLNMNRYVRFVIDCQNVVTVGSLSCLVELKPEFLPTT